MFTDAGATAGAQLEPNATAWTVLSDRNMKQNIVPLNGRDVVEALSDIPICEWSFKHDPAHRRYYGPMAQDFFDGFHLGTDNRHINSGDLDGVALAAIQGLYQMVKDLEEENRSIRAELEAFKSRNR
jgi:hypothetical protein